MLVKSEKEAMTILEQLKKGNDFETLAKRHSTCPSGKHWGDLGEFRRGQMVKAYDDVVFKKEVLKVHGPVKTRFGFHLIKTLYRNGWSIRLRHPLFTAHTVLGVNAIRAVDVVNCAT